MKYLLVVVMAFLISACGGYKPAPQFADDIFEQPVLVKVKIDPEDPNAGVFLQDEIAKMAVNRLNLTLTKNVDLAKSYIVVNSYTINTTPLNYDDNGNIIRYSVNAAIEFAVKDKYGFWSKNIVASEYVDVKPEAATSAFDKEKAGRIAIKKALDSFIVAVMQRSRKVGKQKAEFKSKESKYKESEEQTNMQEPTIKTDTQDSIDTTTSNVDNTDDTTTQNSNVFAQNNQAQESTTDNVNDFDINIVPTNSDIPIKDATMYK
jgi:copper chaperone CopZ